MAIQEILKLIKTETLSDDELIQLQKAIEEEIKKRKQGKNLVTVALETEERFDPRKHGHAYVAVIELVDGKPVRKFIDYTMRAWDSKRKTYKARWEFDAPVGTKIEARLAVSWKNDHRNYYIVSENGLQETTREEVFGI